MTRSPEHERAFEQAAADLATAIRPHTMLADPDAFARNWLNRLWDHGWRPVPRDPRIPQPGQRDPQTAHRGADEVRREFLKATNRTKKTLGEPAE